ncbi:MAG: PVC-type heme-binding CxxCH protein [Bacteroidota bacterium]
MSTSHIYTYCLACLMCILLCVSCEPTDSVTQSTSGQGDVPTLLRVQIDDTSEEISVLREGESTALLTQVAKADFRPYIHPIASPDGEGVLTEYSPGHHKHQTGLYWGFTRVNGRDYFHHPEGDYWKKVSASVIQDSGQKVLWQTIYHLLDEAGKPIMEEKQVWTMREENHSYLLELDWHGKALEDITIGEYKYGGLFLRMPYRKGMDAEVLNAARQKNKQAEGQRAQWVDVGMQIEGRKDFAHITIFDHPNNSGFPQTWRVDGQMGVGPVRARMGEWKIQKGKMEIIQHQILAYTGDFDQERITRAWESYSGKGATYSTSDLWSIARSEGRAAKFLTPQAAVDTMSMMEGMQVNVWASEPMITQPMAFCWDDRGRLWIAENRDYESRRSGFSNSGDSRILILEDTDGDGEADTKKVFMEGVPFPAGIAVGFDGLFLGAPPNLLFVPDADQDDKADMDEIEVRLTGWGIRDRHETLNSLHWGPDGWLYGCEGFATPSKIRKPNGKGKLYGHKEPFPKDLLEADGVDIDGGVWRYHPTKDLFEVVAHGFSNPWGLDYDAKGQLFITACVIPHMFHVIPGGLYHRQGGQHFNPYAYTDIRTIVDHRHRSAHGGARVYQSDAFPAIHQGRLFMANIHEHAVLTDILEPKGSGYVAQHGDEVLLANNAQWIGFSMEVGPEGGVYVLDWHDADICGNEVLHKETGRIFRIMPEDNQAKDFKGRYEDLTKQSDDFLVNLQTSPSDWHARRARVILQYRATKGEVGSDMKSRLQELLHSAPNVDHRLRALWTLHTTNLISEKELRDLLSDKDAHIRAWSVQLANEDKSASEQTLNKMIDMAKNDPSPVVRLYLASALQRLKIDDRWALADALLQHAEDIDDHNIPKMIWFGVEPMVGENPERGLSMASQSKIPLLTELIARRVIDAEKMDLVVAEIARKSPAQLSLMTGMRNGIEGRSDIDPPTNWEATYASLQANNTTAPLAVEIAQLFGDAEATQQFLSTLKNPAAPIEERKKALTNLANKQNSELEDILPDLLHDGALRLLTIRACAAFDGRALGSLLLEKYDTFNQEEKAEVIQTLSSRNRYGRVLTAAIKNGRIPRKDVPAYAARQLRRVVGNGFVEVWGPIDQLEAEDATENLKYRNLLTEGAIASANVRNGKEVFQRTCSACHKMYGEGGNIGPDITGSNRANLDYLLSNILNPSGDIQDDYKMVVITTRDGRTYSGNIASETNRQVFLRIVGQEEAVAISVSNIQSREVTPVSMMPKGLLRTLSDQEVLDLVAYLRTNEPVAAR